MYNFILQIALMLSLGIMVYLIARAVPRIDDEVSHQKTKFDSRLSSFFSSARLEKVDVVLSNLLEKLLRKFKLILMRLDNFITGHLDKVKKNNSNGQKNGKNGEEKPNLFSNLSQNDEETSNPK